MDGGGSHWKDELAPLTGSSWPIRCGHVFESDELTRLRDGGLWPRDVSDRWTIWLDGDNLRCWRSGLGVCIYQASVIVAEDGRGVIPILHVLDDAAVYQRASTDECELERFEGVISLMRRPRDVEADLNNAAEA